jgi:hypothetical protein
MKNTGTVRKQPSVYRGQRVLRGYRRVDVMLTPEASRALKKLTQDGVPATTAICKALVDAARYKR